VDTGKLMTATKDQAAYLEPTNYVDSDHPAVQALAQKYLQAAESDAPEARAIALFEGVRDGFRYDPYLVTLDPDTYRASHVAGQSASYCVPKAILLTALARAAGIPAAAGFADVRNHLNSPKLRAVMGTDLFIYHGYSALWLEDRFVKVTPAFNIELCERFGVKPLSFDGQNDALFHEFDTSNRRHMEYVNDRGIFVDPPIELMLGEFDATYPAMTELIRSHGSLDAVDVAFHGKETKTGSGEGRQRAGAESDSP